MNWIFRKLESLFRKSGNPETRDLEIRESGDQGQKPSVPDHRLTGYPDPRNQPDPQVPGSSSPGSPDRRISFSYVIPVLLALFTGFLMVPTAAAVSATGLFAGTGTVTLLLAVIGLYKIFAFNSGLGADQPECGTFGPGMVRNDGAGYFDGGDQNTSWPKRLLRIRLIQLRLSLLLVSFFGGDNYTDNQEKDPQNGHTDPKNNGEFFKEICGQANGDNGFTKIRNHFADKFPALIADNNHRFNDNMVGNVCQTQFSRVFALLGLTTC